MTPAEAMQACRDGLERARQEAARAPDAMARVSGLVLADAVEAIDRMTRELEVAEAKGYGRGLVDMGNLVAEKLSRSTLTELQRRGLEDASVAIGELRAEAEPWVIWSWEHSGWWRAAELGYTPNFLEAGTYTEARAREIQEGANRYRPADAPNEKAMPISAVRTFDPGVRRV